jgi:hypothetical protein
VSKARERVSQAVPVEVWELLDGYLSAYGRLQRSCSLIVTLELHKGSVVGAEVQPAVERVRRRGRLTPEVDT